MLFLFGLLFIYPPSDYTFEDLGVYQFNSFDIQQVDSKLLVVSDLDNLIAICDENFNILNQFKEVGQGPMEALNPSLLGVTKDSIFITSSDGRVLILDHNLNPSSEQPRKLPILGWGGWSITKEYFALMSDRGNPYGLTILKRKGPNWEITDQLFPLKSKPDLIINDRRLYASSGIGFYCQHDITNRDEYEVEVFDLSNPVKVEPSIRAVLSASTADLEDRSHAKVFIMGAVKSDRAYHVLWVKLDLSKRKTTDAFLDSFSKEGKFLGRKNVAASSNIYQIEGTDLSYLIDRDSAEGTLLNNYIPSRIKPEK